MIKRLIFLAILFVGCSAEEDAGLNIFSESYDFNESTHGWETDYCDYPADLSVDYNDIYQWSTGHSTIPSYLGSQKALMVSANNASGDLFMFIKKKVSGFEPNKHYSVVYEITLASNVERGQGVVLKAGASPDEPRKVIAENTAYQLNLDKGNGNASGQDVIALAEIGESNSYEFKSTTISANAQIPHIVQSNSNGEIWLVVGTDSLFKGVTTVYYTKITVVFSASNQM